MSEVHEVLFTIAVSAVICSLIIVVERVKWGMRTKKKREAMSRVVRVSIECDASAVFGSPVCINTFAIREGETTREARERAKQFGWGTVTHKKRVYDFCIKHRELSLVVKKG